jgi:hypothetical protein
VAARRQDVRVHLQPDVLLDEAEIVEQPGVLLRLEHVLAHGCRSEGRGRRTRLRNGSVCAERSDTVCEGWLAFAGTCTASCPPGRSACVHRVRTRRWSGTHWSAAFASTRSNAASATHSPMSPCSQADSIGGVLLRGPPASPDCFDTEHRRGTSRLPQVPELACAAPEVDRVEHPFTDDARAGRGTVEHARRRTSRSAPGSSRRSDARMAGSSRLVSYLYCYALSTPIIGPIMGLFMSPSQRRDGRRRAT